MWRDKRVLITGHTGFKGAWLALWLTKMGAKVTGFALAPPTIPSLFEKVRLTELIEHIEGDVRDLGAVEVAMQSAQPEAVFHLAAQPLVRYSYHEPLETFGTNVMGTANVLDACRRLDGLKAVVCVTSDKCYENNEWVWPYRENDPMGGFDPYSSSKGAAELVISAYRRSYFQSQSDNGSGLNSAAIASVRAGNVIGGGDWAEDRLIPDIIRALEANNRPLIRSPKSVRPWQHVLEALDGYILIAEKMMQGDTRMATAWNFGPDDRDTRSVGWIVERLLSAYGSSGWDKPDDVQLHEAKVLKLDCSKARTELGWRPSMNLEQALEFVASWHQSVANGQDARDMCHKQLNEYWALSTEI